jgi:16S rRNA processing protein RimM
MTISSDNLFLIGYVVGAFGVRGQLKLKIVTDQPEHIENAIKTVYVRPYSRQPHSAPPVAYPLLNAFLHKPGLMILTLKGITTRLEVENLRQAEVFIHENDALPLDENEFFLHELYAMSVATVDGALLGQVRDVLETGANYVLVVQRENEPEVLIPMTHEVVQQINRTDNQIIVRLIEGLLP